MKYPNLVVLIDSICEAYDLYTKPPFLHTPYTYCNLCVNFIAVRMGFWGFTNSKGMPPVLVANDIVKTMTEAQASGWELLDGATAQLAANTGFLVVAGQKGEPHGHVAVVRPGNMVESSKWMKLVPKVLNIGKTNFIDKGVNFAFDEEPEYFWLRGEWKL